MDRSLPAARERACVEKIASHCVWPSTCTTNQKAYVRHCARKQSYHMIRPNIRELATQEEIPTTVSIMTSRFVCESVYCQCL
jgi:hypothetical protein